MDGGEEMSVSANLKRQRAPLSDSEDNLVPSALEINDGQKRRRLEASGRENRSPKPSSSGRLDELRMKADTPIVPSVRSRVLQLTQGQEGGAPLPQRCLSDPGTDSQSSMMPNKAFKEHLLGEGEFHQRLERFKAPVFQSSPDPTTSPGTPVNPCPRNLSNFVSGIQQKLQDTATPSSKQATRFRQEREQELNQLTFQPITENAWLKRSSSDPSLSEQRRISSGPSSSSSWIPRSRRIEHWPPVQPWELDSGGELKDESFTETATSGPQKPSVDSTDEKEPRGLEVPALSLEVEPSRIRQPQMEQEEQNAGQGEEVRKEKEIKPSFGNEEELPSDPPPQTQTVLQLSFSEDNVFSKAPDPANHNEQQMPTDASQSLLEPTDSDDPNLKEVAVVGEENHKSADCSYVEEEIEPSTDEELRFWRYPRDSPCKGEELSMSVDQEECACATGEQEESTTSRMDVEPGDSVAVSVESNESGVGHSSEQEKTDSKCDQADEGAAEAERSLENNGCLQSEQIPSIGVTEGTNLESRTNETVASQAKAEAESDLINQADTPNECEAPEVTEVEELPLCLAHGVADGGPTRSSEGGESSKKVTFILEPELINDSCSSETRESAVEASVSDVEQSSHDETNTAEIIDQMFEEVLEYAERMEGEEPGGEEDTEDRDSGFDTCSADKEKIDTELEKEKSEEEEEAEDEGDKSQKLESNVDELIFPPSGILSPLSKSVEAVVTPLRLVSTELSNPPPPLLLTPEETTAPPAESAPLYSIDAYRTQRQNKLPTIQSVTPGLQRKAQEKPRPQPSINTKEKIATLTEEAGKLQTVINQTLQALSCCTDEEHGRGSLEEAEAEKLLLVSCEKRSAVLAEVARLREERNSDSAEEDKDYVTQQPCRGTVGITNIQLPLKVEFVCSSHNRTGRPSHYFFILIRYGTCNIVATPLATAADAKNGDTIAFPTTVTLKDIRSTFEIDVEVYSLSHTSANSCTTERTTTRSRVTPRKLLNTITRSSNSLTSAAPPLNTRRSSNFCLVGSHKISLASLGHSKFPLDKMKLDGKIRRLLGEEFQEKVPFLSPLEGHIYLRLSSEGHSSVQHQGFLTMFELINGYGVWCRRYFSLDGCTMRYWNYPNDKETKEPEGSISLSSSPNQCVRPVKRDSCARPFTFELVNNMSKQQDDPQETMAKCWFSADTKQERLDWIERLGQALLDFHTWNRTSEVQNESQQSNTSRGNLRESIL